MTMRVSWSRPGGVLVASITGRVDSGNSAAFHSALDEGTAQGDHALVLDCRHLSYMSSAGLRVLLAMARKFRNPGRGIGICQLSDSLLSVITASGFDRIIPVHETRTDAINALSGSGDAGAADTDAAHEDAPVEGDTTPIPIRSAVNMDIVGDNIADIAAFTVEKYEFANEDLPPDARADAVTAVKEALWREVEVWQERRKTIMAGMFRTAAAALDRAIERQA